MRWYAIAMTLDIVDTVWSSMRKDEFYSPRDLANILGQPSEAVLRVLEFLSRYGFAHRVTEREWLFTKVMNAPGPGDALRILGALVGDDSANTGRMASVSKTPRGLRQPYRYPPED
jgi:hypothetical protein